MTLDHNPDILGTSSRSQPVKDNANHLDGDGNRSVQGDDNYSISGNENNVDCQFVRIDNAYININQQGKSDKHERAKTDLGRATFILSGSFEGIDEEIIKAMADHLKQITGDTKLTIRKVEKSSIKVTIDAEPETLELLKELFESGELNKLLEFPIEDVRILDKDELFRDKFDIFLKLTQNQSSRQKNNAEIYLEERSKNFGFGFVNQNDDTYLEALTSIVNRVDNVYSEMKRGNFTGLNIRRVDRLGADVHPRYFVELREGDRSYKIDFLIAMLNEFDEIAQGFRLFRSKEQLDKINQIQVYKDKLLRELIRDRELNSIANENKKNDRL
jgi:hypothetical protein